MCGRYSLASPDADLLRRRFDLRESARIELEARYNVAPTDPVLAVRRGPDGTNEPGTLRWGLVPGRWAERGSGRPLINARAETIERQPAFRESFAERRCLIPADGFYEWLTDERGKRPLWFSLAEGGLFAFAGIWAGPPPAGGRAEVHSCAIVTTEPNAEVRPVHDRMPVVLPREAEAAWLDPAASAAGLRELLAPAPAGTLVAREVSDYVNDVREDGPHLIEPREEQSSLF